MEGNFAMATSLPGLLANYISTKYMLIVTSESGAFERGISETPYFIDNTLKGEDYLRRAVEVISQLAEKLDEARVAVCRLDPTTLRAFFGLAEGQRSALRCTRHNNLVILRVFADLFIPEFRAAEQYWALTFFRTYHWAYPNEALIEKWNKRFGGSLQIIEKEGRKCLRSRAADYLCDEWEERLLRDVGPTMRDRLRLAVEKIGLIAERLASNEVFARLSDAAGERRAQSISRNVEVSFGDLMERFDSYLDPVLIEKLSCCPTLTMEAEFSLDG